MKPRKFFSIYSSAAKAHGPRRHTVDIILRSIVMKESFTAYPYAEALRRRLCFVPYFSGERFSDVTVAPLIQR